MSEPVSTSLESLRSAAKQLAKERHGGFYPDIFWYDLERYVRLVRRGAIFRVEDGKLKWEVSE